MILVLSNRFNKIWKYTIVKFFGSLKTLQILLNFFSDFSQWFFSVIFFSDFFQWIFGHFFQYIFLRIFWDFFENFLKLWSKPLEFFKRYPEMEGNWNPFGPPKFQTTKVLSEKSRNVFFSGTFSFTFSQPSTLKM